MNKAVEAGTDARDGVASQAETGFVAQRLGDFAEGLAVADVPAAVLERAKLHLLDCFGIGLASTGFDFAQRAANAVRGLSGDGASPVIGMAMRLPPRDAALLNGTLIHGLDFDDTHGAGVIHASTSVVPTVLAAGLRRGISGREALLAYLVGVETASRIGMAAEGGFHARGLHPTGLVGAFGCALAAGRIAELTAGQLASAQGIALSMAAGSLEFLEDGAWTKRLHPGWAAVAGITAAALAKEGFLGPRRAYEGRYGLYKLHLGADSHARVEMATAGLGSVWELENVAFKPYPSCHFNHAFADAALALRANGLRSEQVASITALLAPEQASVVCEPEANKKRPQNAYDAQFSVHYTVAAALVRGRFGLADLEPEAIADPAVLELAARVGYAIDPASAFPRYYSGELVVRTTDGRELRHRESVNRGSDAKPLSTADIEAKFRANAERAVGRRRVERVYDAVMGLDAAPDLTVLGDALCLG